MNYSEETYISTDNSAIISRLVNNLVYLFKIAPSDDSLTFILGFGGCQRNDDALQQWVKAHLDCQAIEIDKALEFLSNLLEDELSLKINF